MTTATITDYYGKPNSKDHATNSIPLGEEEENHEAAATPMPEEKDSEGSSDLPRCPACGHRMQEATDRFCMYCRWDLRPLHNRFCECGYSAAEGPYPNPNKRFCPLCGKPVTYSPSEHLRNPVPA